MLKDSTRLTLDRKKWPYMNPTEAQCASICKATKDCKYIYFFTTKGSFAVSYCRLFKDVKSIKKVGNMTNIGQEYSRAITVNIHCLGIPTGVPSTEGEKNDFDLCLYMEVKYETCRESFVE